MFLNHTDLCTYTRFKIVLYANVLPGFEIR